MTKAELRTLISKSLYHSRGKYYWPKDHTYDISIHETNKSLTIFFKGCKFRISITQVFPRANN